MSEDSGGPTPENPDHLGHRARLRERFLKGGGDALNDYEMIELLLFAAQPRRDMKPLAKRLLKQFGSFADVISAPGETLAGVEGMGVAAVAALKITQAAALRLARNVVLDRSVMTSWQQVVDYCHASMAHSPVEQLRVLFLDRRNAMICDEVQQTGTVDHTPLYPREVVKRALELGATGIILVHNHPSGDPSPSKADIAMTKAVADASEKLGITLHDHIIVARSGHVSLKAMGLI
ncbi:MAG: JAB domain-containing protein [Alphaproteobacteria bacterium]|nr:JAB domain-containing protein [Alphaproteobacteria bacterium]